MNEEKLTEFIEVYKLCLTQAVLKYPDKYAYPVNDVPVVVERMKKAIERGSFSKEGPAFVATCSLLHIKHTYKDIREFLNGEENL